MKILQIFAFSVMALFMLAFPAFALDQASPAQVANTGLNQWDLGTYVGLSAAVIGAIGGLKKLFPTWINGKEPVLGLVFSYVLGIATKLFIPGAYKDVNWVIFLLSLLVVVAGAKFGHDHLLNTVIKNKPDGGKA